VVIDVRGRLRLPAWLRLAADATGTVLVGRRTNPGVVVVAGTGVLDGIGDLLIGERP
jgi:hypothetical protein